MNQIKKNKEKRPFKEYTNFLKVMASQYENTDHNKQMMKMVDYAKCVSVRDEQIK